VNDFKPIISQNGDVVSFYYAPPRVWAGHKEFFVWDLDRTYLDTIWNSLPDLIRVAREKAFQKKNVPGTLSLVQGLKRTWISRGHKEPFPLVFVTASPPQMEERIREKLLLDDVLPVGIFFKDNLKNLTFKRWRRLNQQVGFKVQALLQLRAELGDDVRQIFWGDDSESDAVIYSLYSDLCARRFTSAEFKEILNFFKVSGEQTDVILDIRDQTPNMDPVERIYINLATDTDPEYYQKFGWRMLPTYTTFQTALDLYQMENLSLAEIIKVAQDMVWNYGYTPDELTASLLDSLRRRLISKKTLNSVLPPLVEQNLLLPDFDADKWSVDVLPWEDEPALWINPKTNYLHDWR
jgi:hypothetical protein